MKKRIATQSRLIAAIITILFYVSIPDQVWAIQTKNGWGYSITNTVRTQRFYVDNTGKEIPLKKGQDSPTGEESTKTITVVKFDPPAETILSGRLSLEFDPSIEVWLVGWYGEFGADPNLPAPPIGINSSDDVDLLQSGANPAMLSSSIAIQQNVGKAVFEFDWGLGGFLPTKNLSADGHFNSMGLVFDSDGPVQFSIIGSPEDVAINGVNASTYILCSSGFCGDMVPESCPPWVFESVLLALLGFRHWRSVLPSTTQD